VKKEHQESPKHEVSRPHISAVAVTAALETQSLTSGAYNLLDFPLYEIEHVFDGEVTTSRASRRRKGIIQGELSLFSHSLPDIESVCLYYNGDTGSSEKGSWVALSV